MLGIVDPEDYEWHYDYADEGLKRDDDCWKKLLLSSNSPDVNLSNPWKLNSEGFNQVCVNFKPNHKLVRDLVNSTEPVGNARLECKRFQTILGIGRGKVIHLNRLPVFLQGRRIDIVNMLHKC